MVWAWMLWESYALGNSIFRSVHGCSGNRMLLEMTIFWSVHACSGNRMLPEMDVSMIEA